MPCKFVIPSYRFAIDEDKTRLITKFKEYHKDKPCKFERDGRNNCRFKNNCFYKHTLPFNDLPPQRQYSLRLSPNTNYILNVSYVLILFDYFNYFTNLFLSRLSSAIRPFLPIPITPMMIFKFQYYPITFNCLFFFLKKHFNYFLFELKKRILFFLSCAQCSPF